MITCHAGWKRVRESTRTTVKTDAEKLLIRLFCPPERMSQMMLELAALAE